MAPAEEVLEKTEELAAETGSHWPFLETLAAYWLAAKTRFGWSFLEVLAMELRCTGPTREAACSKAVPVSDAELCALYSRYGSPVVTL